VLPYPSWSKTRTIKQFLPPFSSFQGRNRSLGFLVRFLSFSELDWLLYFCSLLED
jgi:hypothetical protein